MTHTAYLALGSNLGDRAEMLTVALEKLHQHPEVKLRKLSSFHETEPVGGPTEQPAYLNAACEVETSLPPTALLALLLQIETSLGRVRTERWGPRTLDLDLLLYDQEVLRTPELELPHPRLHERAFVLAPLVEIAPKVVHPQQQQQTIRTLLKRVRPSPPKSESENYVRGYNALVTGSTTGIGQAIAFKLAHYGCRVLVHGRKSVRQGIEVQRKIVEMGRSCQILLADLAQPHERARLAHDAWELTGGLEILVNNAGVDVLTGPAAHWTFEEKLAALWQVDVCATIELSRTLGARMSSGSILTIGWDQAEAGMEGDSAQLFAACKGAVMAFTRSLAVSLAPKVRVNCVAPGWIRTAWGETASAAWQERVLRETPMKCWGYPEDVAKVAADLVSPNWSYITGQIIRVNGGAVRS